MKRNTLLLLVLAALVGVAYFAQQGKTARLTTAIASVKQRTLLLPDLAVNDIKKIRIRESDKQVNLGVTDGKWTVAERNNYPASFDKIKRALTSLHDLKIAGGQPVSKENLASLKLLSLADGSTENTGLQFDLMNDKGETLASFIVGKNVESSGGASADSFSGPEEQRFIRIAKEDGTAWLVSEGFSELQPNPQDWIDKSFVDVRKLKTAQIANAWGAERKDENSEFTLMEPKNGDELDTAKVGSLATLLSNPTFTDVLPKDKGTPEFMKDAITAKLTTFEDFTYEVRLLDVKEPGKEGESKDYLTFNVTASIPNERTPEKDEKEEDKKKKDEEFAAKKKELEAKLAKEKSLEGWVFEVSNYTVNTLLKRRGEVLRDKPAAPPEPENKVSVPSDAVPTGAVPVPAPPPEPAPQPETTPATPPPIEKKSTDDKKPVPAKPAPSKPAADKKKK
ncbi:MAG: DUF4340 domain-containing protein [Verrucomicrobia bacterium]|nr:DUF4340 domain-containing protein [Verrucomicrobiota bacterium]